jgi:hypothetical protein
MKKTIYIVLATLLWLLISFLMQATLEIFYIDWAIKRHSTLPEYSGLTGFLPNWMALGFLILGLAAGVTCGFWWWDVVYIKRLRFKNKKS